VHPSWKINGEIDATVDMTTGTRTSGSITVEGYDIVGSVFSSGIAMPNVQFTLAPCPQDVDCQTESNEKGQFNFLNIPSGSYMITPYYKGFQLAPQQLSVTLKRDTLTLEKPFEIVGFTVSGSLERALENVVIFVNKKKAAVTDKDGKFELHEISSGKKYTIEAQLENYTFEKLSNVEFHPSASKAQLATPIRITHVNVCGTLKFQPAFKPTAKSVSLYQQQKKIATASLQDSSTTGSLCLMAPTGHAASSFEIKVDVTEDEAKSGFAVKPASVQLQLKQQEVLSEPILDGAATAGIYFEQVMVSLHGHIKPLEGNTFPPQGSLKVHLEFLKTGSSISTDVTADGKFTFNNVVPKSSYRVSVSTVSTSAFKWCWKQSGQQKVDVDTSNVENIELAQEGVMAQFVASHDNISLKKSTDGSIQKLKKGHNEFCLKSLNAVSFTPIALNDCTKFDKESYTFDPKNPAVIQVKIAQVLVKGEISATTGSSNDMNDDEGNGINGEDGITISVMMSNGKALFDIKATRKTSSSSSGYEYQFWASFGTSLSIKPQSTVFLFEPASLDVTVPDQQQAASNCPVTTRTIKGIRGVFLKGKVYPSVADAVIKIFKPKSSELLVSVKTNAKGEYRAGPLYSADAASPEELVVTAEKTGFQLVQSPNNKFEFSSVRLSQVSAKLTTDGSTPLSGVFLSLVSADGDNAYRTSAISNANGQVAFTGLLPGSYFVMPVLKEYTFEPKDVAFELADGNDKEVAIVATRVLYSAFGRIVSLNGKPLANVVVEAQPEKQEQQGKSKASMEETKTDANGSYRIRGLKPNVKYTIRVKPTGAAERATPAHLQVSQAQIKDVYGLDFLSFAPLSQTHNVITGEVEFEDSGLYKTAVTHNNAALQIDVELLSGADPMAAKVIRTQRLTLSKQYQFILPKNATQSVNYYIRLTSNLNKQAYVLNTPLLPAKNLQTGELQHVVYPFKPVLKKLSFDEDKVNTAVRPQFYMLLAIIVALVVAFNSDKFKWLFDMFSSNSDDK